MTNDVGGLVRIALGQFADAVHRLGVDLALDLGDVDQCRGGNQALAGRAVGISVGQGRQGGGAGQAGDHFGSQDPLDQRTDHHEQHHEAEQHHDAELDDVHHVVLGKLDHAEPSGRLGDVGDGRGFGEFEVDDLDLVAALLIEADRRAHQCGDAVELLLAALLIDHLAFFVLDVAAVDQHRDREAVDPPDLGHLGLGGAGDLVIVGLFALLALVARDRSGVPVLVARQFVVDGDLAVVAGGGAGFFPGLARAQHPALGIELVGGLGDLVVVEIGRELDPGAAGADHRGHDGLDLVAHPLLEAGAAIVAGGVVGLGAGAIGEQLTGLVDDRDPLRLQPVDGGSNDVADRLDLLRLQRSAQPHHDGSRRFRRLARKQRTLGQHQMDAGGLDAVDGADGPGQFALQRTQMIDVLDEAGGAERVGFVEDLVADAAALGQAALGKLHAQPGDLVFRHHDDRAFVAQFERYRLALQVLDDPGRILGAEVGKQGSHLRRGDAHDDEREEADQRCGDSNHRHQPRGAQTP